MASNHTNSRSSSPSSNFAMNRDDATSFAMADPGHMVNLPKVQNSPKRDRPADLNLAVSNFSAFANTSPGDLSLHLPAKPDPVHTYPSQPRVRSTHYDFEDKSNNVSSPGCQLPASSVSPVSPPSAPPQTPLNRPVAEQSEEEWVFEAYKREQIGPNPFLTSVTQRASQTPVDPRSLTDILLNDEEGDLGQQHASNSFFPSKGVESYWRGAAESNHGESPGEITQWPASECAPQNVPLVARHTSREPVPAEPKSLLRKGLDALRPKPKTQEQLDIERQGLQEAHETYEPLPVRPDGFVLKFDRLNKGYWQMRYSSPSPGYQGPPRRYLQRSSYVDSLKFWFPFMCFLTCVSNLVWIILFSKFAKTNE